MYLKNIVFEGECSMNKLVIKNLKFYSFIKISVLILFPLGVMIGLISFIIGILGGPVTVNIGSKVLEGAMAGIVSLFFAPLICSLIGLMFSLITFLPFKALLFLSKGIGVSGEFVINPIESEEESKSISANLKDIDSENDKGDNDNIN